MKTTADIRADIIEKYKNNDFVVDKTGVKLVELIGESFLVDDDWIIRKPNLDYVERELEWYRSMSLYVADIPGKTPKIWNDVADVNGKINSNYGWCIYSEENGSQYNHVLAELKKNPFSRRATMIYNRPSMHTDYCIDGMGDFICTYSNQFFIRNDKLISQYIIRSNDAIFGFCNDVHWSMFVHQQLADDLSIEKGDLIWSASSLHVYERHFPLIEELITRNESDLEEAVS